MKKSSIMAVLTVTVLMLNACSKNPAPLSANDQIATIVAATLSAATLRAPPTEIPATPTPPIVDSLSINGQLQGRLAFIRNNNLWVSINGVESQLTTDAIPSSTGLPELWYSNPQISPDGTKVAFLKNARTDARTLMVSDIDGKNLRQLANDVEWVLPAVEWSRDSQKLYYPVSKGFDVTTGFENMAVNSINQITGEIQEDGQFNVRQGCGGGSSDPADGLSWGEKYHQGWDRGLLIFLLKITTSYIQQFAITDWVCWIYPPNKIEHWMVVAEPSFHQMAQR